MDPNETNAYWYGYRVGYSRGRQDGLPWVREIVERRRQQAREGSDPCGVAACNDILAGLHKIEAGASQQGHDGTVKVPVDEHTQGVAPAMTERMIFGDRFEDYPSSEQKRAARWKKAAKVWYGLWHDADEQRDVEMYEARWLIADLIYHIEAPLPNEAEEKVTRAKEWLNETRPTLAGCGYAPTIPTISHHVEGGYVWTDCPVCGPDVKVDEDGCCISCGRDAVHFGKADAPEGDEQPDRSKYPATGSTVARPAGEKDGSAEMSQSSGVKRSTTPAGQGALWELLEARWKELDLASRNEVAPLLHRFIADIQRVAISNLMDRMAALRAAGGEK